MFDRTEWCCTYKLLEYSCKVIRNKRTCEKWLVQFTLPSMMGTVNNSWVMQTPVWSLLYWHWNISVLNFPLDELHYSFGALQHLTDDGPPQKLPPSGPNTETAQGDAPHTAMCLSPSCSALYDLSTLHRKISPCLSLYFCLDFIVTCCSVLPAIQ